MLSNKLKFCMPFLLSFIILLTAVEAEKPCQKRRYDRNSFVCVCSGQQCDSPDPVGEFNADQLVYYVSDVNTYRLARNVAEKETQSEDVPMLKVSINASQQFQRIFGFGGAFTDAAGINLNTLSKASRKLLLQQYFDPKDGIGYTVGRVPIASCDFSTSAYSYLDTPNDFNLSTFQLAKEDLEAKIPHILAANEMTNNQLRLFGSPWSAPGWMKTTGKMKGGGQLKPPFNGQYYETYAHYYRRFIEEYAKRNVSFWGLTIENEPGAGAVPLWSWQAMFLSNQMQRDFAHQLLSPILKQSEASKNVKIMGHDDQRSGILEAAKEMYADPAKASAIDGLASHWYSHSAYDVLQKAHAVRPDKFILATEACTGYLPTQHKPNLGDWSRGVEYGHDILNNLRNWVVGWTDWNLCLDLQGGPNWVQNFVDAPIIVNATADEFYKQPMFYFLAHFSHFVPRDSVVISSSLISPNGTTLADRPWEPRNVRPFLTRDEYFMNSKTQNQWSANPVEHVAFRTPDGNRVLVIINSNRVQSHRVQVGEASDPQRNWILDIAPYSIYTAIWQKKT